MTRPQPLDEFRRVLAGASRAIAHDRELDIAFAAEPGAADRQDGARAFAGPVARAQAGRRGARRGRRRRAPAALP